MVMLAEHYDYIIGGDPDRDTVDLADLAVVDTATGGLRAHMCDRTDGAGYVRILDWARAQAPGRRVWALEGTGSFAAGLAAALALARVMRRLLFEIHAFDPATFAGVVFVLAAVAFIATVIPALRAARIDPIESLRSE